MRLLVTFAGGQGHLEPLIPLARAAEAAGHQVAFSGRPRMVPIVGALGFPAFAAGSDAGLTPQRVPLRPLDPQREDRVLREGFAGRIARERAQDLLRCMQAWEPEVVVAEETDFGALVIAEHLRLPYATLLVSAASSFVRPELIAEPLHALRAAYELPADPDLEFLHRYLVLTPFPPSLRHPAYPLPGTTHGIRHFPLPSQAPTVCPPELAGLEEAPTVYVTLGTVFNWEAGDLMARILEGLREPPINVVATVGRDVDPAEFGPQPPQVRLVSYLSQAEILPHCDLVVCHGGSGTVLGALAHGLPLVLTPLGADQPHNAARCAALGVAQVLDALQATSQSIAEVVWMVLNEPTYRRAAEGLRDQIAALPEPHEAVLQLDRLRSLAVPS